MSSGSQKRTAISRVSRNRRSLFRKVEVEHHEAVGAALKRGDQPGAGPLMCFMHKIGITRGGVAKVDGEAMREAARERLRTDIGAEFDLAHAVDDLSQCFEVGMDRRTGRTAAAAPDDRRR